MAIHKDNQGIIRESIREYLHVAEYCLEYRKEPAVPGQKPGCLGYPTAVMLFIIVDTIGSFHRGSNDLMGIDGKRIRIGGDAHQHFYALNSEYYGQSLDDLTIRKLFKNFRSLLVHNSSLARSHFLLNEPNQPDLFPERNGALCVNLFPFFEKSREAARLFLERLDQIVPASKQAANIALKR